MPPPDEPAIAVCRHKFKVLHVDALGTSLGGKGVAFDEVRDHRDD